MVIMHNCAKRYIIQNKLFLSEYIFHTDMIIELEYLKSSVIKYVLPIIQLANFWNLVTLLSSEFRRTSTIVFIVSFLCFLIDIFLCISLILNLFFRFKPHYHSLHDISCLSSPLHYALYKQIWNIFILIFFDEIVILTIVMGPSKPIWSYLNLNDLYDLL